MSTKQRTKPEKPYPDFPLFAHRNGQWAKKIQGKLRYFGPWNDPQGALEKYRELESANGKPETKQPTETIANSTGSEKPAKPYKDFPLFAHDNGQWAKKIRGKLHYFGPWDNAEAALNTYLDQRDDLQAGRKPRRKGDGLTVEELCDRFIYSKELLVNQGEIKQRTRDDYHDVCKRVLAVFGKTRLVDDLRPDDFEELKANFAKSRGPTAIGNDIQRVRCLFKYAYDQDLIERPIKYGQGFKKPSKKTLRKVRAAKGPRLFTPTQLCKMVGEASRSLRAMILLGINCGFGNNDCATLPLSAVDLKAGWIDFPRPKTGVERRCPLWPETIAALREVIAHRPEAISPEHSDRVFLTARGGSWESTKDDTPVAKEMAKLLKKLKMKKPGLSFYTLRHVFQTIGEEAGESPTKFIMGHAPASEDMSASYRELIRDERLRKITDHVRSWYLGSNAEQAGGLASGAA